MILNNIIYAVGGFNSSTYVTTVEAFTPPEATTQNQLECYYELP